MADETEELGSRLAVLEAQLAGDLTARPEGPVARQIDEALNELDLGDANSVIFFGAKAQQKLAGISDSMLEQVRTKDAGPAGDALNRMVQKLRELDVTGVDAGQRPGLVSRLLGVKNDLKKYVDKYEDVRTQVDRITLELEQHKTKLLEDVIRLDRLYDANL